MKRRRLQLIHLAVGLCLLAFGQGVRSVEAQPLHHTRDLHFTLSSETLGRGVFSLQGAGLVQGSDFQSYTGLAVGLGRFIDVVGSFSTFHQLSESAENITLGFKIGDPPFLNHHFGLMPSVSFPVGSDEQPIVGLRFMHVIEPELLAYPTKFYFNYGYHSQDAPDDESIFTHRDFLVGGLGAKMALSRSVLLAELNVNTYVDFNNASFSESRFTVSGGTRMPLIGNTSLSFMLSYRFSVDDAATQYVPDDNQFMLTIGLTRLFFPDNRNLAHLKKMSVEQTHLDEQLIELSDLQRRRAIHKRDVAALKDLLNSYYGEDQ